MRIIVIGNFEAPFSTENDWAWTYEKMGHEVIKLQENQATTDEIWKEAQKGADLVHYVHTHGWKTPGTFGIEELLKKLKLIGITTIGVHLDYWRGLDREKDVGTHPWWKCEYIFTADGGSNDWYREKGINHYYLKAGVVERDCYLGTPREEYKHDVIFVGSKGYHSEWQYRAELIDFLRETYGDRFVHYGGDGKEVIRGKDLNDLYASAKVVVGDSLCLGFNHPDYFSDRLFETTGRGGFIIFPDIKGIEECYVLGEEIVLYKFGDFNMLQNLIDYFVKADKTRERIKLAGFEKTKDRHTYTKRAEEMLIILKKEK